MQTANIQHGCHRRSYEKGDQLLWNEIENSQAPTTRAPGDDIGVFRICLFSPGRELMHDGAFWLPCLRFPGGDKQWGFCRASLPGQPGLYRLLRDFFCWGSLHVLVGSGRCGPLNQRRLRTGGPQAWDVRRKTNASSSPEGQQRNYPPNNAALALPMILLRACLQLYFKRNDVCLQYSHPDIVMIQQTRGKERFPW